MKPVGRLLFFLLLSALTIDPCPGQTPQDSIAIADAHWKILIDTTGIRSRRANIRVFDSDQSISLIELSPEFFALDIAQENKRATVDRLAKNTGAVAAINASFFRTDTNDAISTSYLKSDGTVLSDNSWGNGVIAIDSLGNLRLAAWGADTNKDMHWQEQFPDVLVSNAILVENSRSFTFGDDKRHPRSMIGLKPDGTIVMAVVDGRQKKMDGMTLTETAFTARILGMETSVNLDGGGSSSLWLKNHRYINSPSDRAIFPKARKVANAIIVTRK